MSIPNLEKQGKRQPIWILVIGLFGIVNFIACSWFLLPTREGNTVYLRAAEIYGHILLPSLILLPVSVIMVGLWISGFAKKLQVQRLVLVASFILSILCFVPALGTSGFISTLHVIGKVKQSDHVYYLVKHFDDFAPYYSFCESNNAGFSGECSLIAWKGDDDDPKIYIDPITDLVIIKSVNPSFIWTNSVPPRCINDWEENTDEEFVGGCIQ